MCSAGLTTRERVGDLAAIEDNVGCPRSFEEEEEFEVHPTPQDTRKSHLKPLRSGGGT